ncbi:hypothetical protein [Streptomyces sp. NPDC094032]|uniref:hypothetical protein n=1 Tax=Streptomyces sp. NPDC094032 TaxID=3155308 RepID=UPI0033229808
MTPPPVEERLRAAFAARAALVTVHDLRREAPPQGSRRGTRRFRTLAALGAAAAVAAVCVLALLPNDGPLTPAPVLPARTPAHTATPQAPTPAPSTPYVSRPGTP